MLVKKEFDPADLQRAAELLEIIRKFLKARCYAHESVNSVSSKVEDTQINFGYIKRDDSFVIRNARLKPYISREVTDDEWIFKTHLPKLLLGFINEGDLTFEDLERFCFRVT